MKKIHLVLLATFASMLVSYSAFAVCPLGAKEDHLTIQRVMRNFGRFTGQADMVAIKSLTPYEVISDKDLAEASDSLGLAIDCAQAVLDNPTAEGMIPREGKNKTAAENKEYMDDLVYFMTDFRDLLLEYRELLKALLQTPATERNFKSLQEKRNEIDKLVDHAHRKL